MGSKDSKLSSPTSECCRPRGPKPGCRFTIGFGEFLCILNYPPSKIVFWGWRAQFWVFRPQIWVGPHLLCFSWNCQRKIQFSVRNLIFESIFRGEIDFGTKFSDFDDFCKSAQVISIWRTFLEPTEELETTKNKISRKKVQTNLGFKYKPLAPKTHWEK